jgi:hypothetical protein
MTMNVNDLDIDTMNADELRALANQVMDQLLDGTLTAAQANVVSRAIGKRLAVVGAVMKAAKITRDIEPAE